MNIHHDIYNQMNMYLHQKDTEKQLLGASSIYIKYITNYAMKPVALLNVKN